MRPPEIAVDLFHELRERRLLPVVAALAVAVVAVPIVLSRSGGSQPPPPPPADIGAAPEAQTAVLAEAPRLRDYRRRLDVFKQRNPFKQQFLFPSSGSGSEAIVTQDAGSGSGGSGGGGSGTTSTSATATIDSSGSGSVTIDSGGDAGSTVKTESKLVSFAVDVRAGPVGKTRRIEKVGPLGFVPGEQRPLAVFMAAGIKADRAVFVVSREVSETSGEGRCLPGRGSCEFLILKEGEEQRLTYAPDGRTYKLKLLGVTRIEEDVRKALGAKGSGGRRGDDPIKGLADTIGADPSPDESPSPDD